MDDSGKAKTYSIRAVERVCDILDLLGAAPGPVPLADIVAVSGLPKSSTFRYLATLEARRYVDRPAPSAGFQLGSAVTALHSGRVEALARRILPMLEALRDEFDETANLGVLDGAQVAYLRIVESRRAVRLAARPNDRDDLHSTALGKVLLAAMPDDRARGLVVEPFVRKTDRTIADWTALAVELAVVREQGFAIDDCENEPDGRCVAVRLTGLDAAISVSGPESRMTPDVVAEVVRRIRELAADAARL